MCFADNHMESVNNFFPALTTYEAISGTGGPVKDNIFAAEFDDHPDEAQAAPDSFLVISLFVLSEGNKVANLYDALQQ